MGKSQLQRPFAHLRIQTGSIDLSTVERHSAIVETPPTDAPLCAAWHSEADTAAFAAALARCAAIRNAFITLKGDLGAGKTTLVRHLLRALGVPGRIKSPTYAVVEPHEAPASAGDAAALSIWHFDFYRFDNPREWEDAGFRDIFASPGLKLAEWPDNACGVLPLPDLEIQLTSQPDDSRIAVCQPHTATGTALLAGVPR